jgi:ribose transport system permease protein
MNLGLALSLGFGFSVLMGLITGFLIAYVEIPALFATLAMGAFIYGFGRFRLLTQDVIALPPNSDSIAWIGTGHVLGAPMPVILLAGFSSLAFVFLRYTSPGRMIYGIGDNYLSARITGLPVRPIQVAQYALSAAIAYAAGIITATAVNSMNTRIVNSTLIYDIILVVVLGGVGLSGGKGGVRNVLVGTVLIGILLNGMTIMDIQYTLQNVIKSLILLIAIVVDSLVNPRDEQTAQQGDI